MTEETKSPVISVSHLVKDFGKVQVLKDIDFETYFGEVICVIGSSGSGKSTLLRCINMLEVPTGGNIYFHGRDIMSRDIKITKYRAKVGMVFQQFNLFNNKTVLGNCTASGEGPEEKQKGSRRDGDEVPGEGRYGSVHQRETEPDLRRTEAESRDRKSARHGAGGSSFRRTDERT
jgi:ABC-type histidine transport system ATPase subunit